jgi:hypothetical protein
MIPPIAPETLNTNPAFARVWKYVTEHILEDDASLRSASERRRWEVEDWTEMEAKGTKEFEGPGEGTEDVAKKKERLDFEDVLNEIRVECMKREISRTVLGEIAYQDDGDVTGQNNRIPVVGSKTRKIQHNDDDDGNGLESGSMESCTEGRTRAVTSQQQLSSHVKDLSLFISTCLNAGHSISTNTTVTIGQTATEEDMLLEEDISNFKDNLTTISSAVSTHLIGLEASLSAIACIGTNDTDTSVTPSHDKVLLHDIIQPQLDHLHTLRNTTLPPTLDSLGSTLHAYLSTNTSTINLNLRTLESTKHGIPRRHTLSLATFLSTVASALDLKTQVLVHEARRSADSKETRSWLQHRLSEMEQEEKVVDERLKVLTDVVAEYEHESIDPGHKVMRKLGSKYKEIESETEQVKEDIEKLEKQVW